MAFKILRGLSGYVCDKHVAISSKCVASIAGKEDAKNENQ